LKFHDIFSKSDCGQKSEPTRYPFFGLFSYVNLGSLTYENLKRPVNL
jgi:hypothetical protein